MSRRTPKRPPSVGPAKQVSKKPLTLEERERALAEREEELDAREAELVARARALAAREAALREERPPSVPPPPAPPPPPPPQALVKIFSKLNERIKLSEEFEATALSQRKVFLKAKGRSYQHVYDGRALIVVRKLYDGHIERFYALFHGSMESVMNVRNVVRLEHIMKVVRFLERFTKKLLPADADALLNSFRVRVCTAECMAKVIAWLNEDGEDIDNDVADDFSNRVTALLYETLPEAVNNPPPISVLAPFLPQLQALTTSEARRNAALNEKIQFFQDWTKAVDTRVFIAEAHKNEREVKAGYALHKLKEAYAAEGEASFYGIFSPDDLMETIVSVARLAAKLSSTDLSTFVRVVWSTEQSRKVAEITRGKSETPKIVQLRELLSVLERQWDREQILRVLRCAGLPENPRGPLDRFIKSLPEFVEILRLLYKPADQQRAQMSKRVEDLYETLLEVKKGLAAETRRNRAAALYSEDGQEELAPPPRPLWNRHSAWIMALAYFDLLGDDIKECGVSDELYDKVHTMEFPTHISSAK